MPAPQVANLGQFLSALEQEKRKAGDLVGLATRRIALGVLSRVVLASPVDTGRFRGNWQVDVGRDPIGAIDGTDVGGGGTIARGTATISGAPPFRPIIIANNLAYGPRLNDGWSKQAPAGFVQAAVDAEVSPFQ